MDYTGLDPHFAAEAAIAGVRNETLGLHLVQHSASYDAGLLLSGPGARPRSKGPFC